jgi:hypothetical protein
MSERVTSFSGRICTESQTIIGLDWLGGELNRSGEGGEKNFCCEHVD